MGKSISIEDSYSGITAEVEVTGIFRNIGSNSTLVFDWLMPAAFFYSRNSWVDDWGNGSFYTFLSIPNPQDVNRIRKRILDEINKHTDGNKNAGNEQLILQKFEDTYLYSNFDNGVVSGGRITYVRILIAVAAFILIVACINYMNLTTARAGRRSKEIGLRKVMGARKVSIRYQFYLESFLNATVSVGISIIILVFLLPYFNQLVDKSLVIHFTHMNTWLIILGSIFTVGMLSGSYPAVVLPAFSITRSLKGGIHQSSFATIFRKSLVILQFAISVFLLIGTFVIYKQIHYVMSKDLGLDKENLVAVTMHGDLPERYETYKNELMKIPSVSNVTVISGNPVNYGRSTSSASWEGKDPSEGYEVNVIITDKDFIKTMSMEIIKGRDFSYDINDSSNFIINEVAADLMGFENPLHKKLGFWGIEGQITGVVKNFNMQNLYEPIAPLIITCRDPRQTSLALVRIKENTSEALKSIEENTLKLNPEYDFEYEFVDQTYSASYENEKTVSTLVNIFAVISILISALGIYGLASYTSEQRSMEIGIRKVYGASVRLILILLTKDYARLIFFAFVLSIPFGYFISRNWLDSFAFRTNLDPLIFIVAGGLVFLVGVLTVIMKSYHAATLNPVDSLRDE
jgi:ABC-type antimicrobial peptide transport system permease subunit